MRKFPKLEKIEKYEEEVPFRENVFIFLKASFKKWEGAKYAGVSRPSCYSFFPTETFILSMTNGQITQLKLNDLQNCRFVFISENF